MPEITRSQKNKTYKTHETYIKQRITAPGKKWQSRKDSTPQVCRSESGGNLPQRIITAHSVPGKRKTFEPAEEILFPQAVSKAFSE